MNLGSLTTGALSLLLLSCTNMASANPEAPGMYDAKNQGMGGAGIAHLETPAAIFHNPANLSFTRDSQYQGNFTALIVKLGGTFGGPENYQETEWLPVPLPFLGFTERVSESVVMGGAFYFALGFGGGYEDVKQFGTGRDCTSSLADIFTESDGFIALNPEAQNNDLCLENGREEYVGLAIFEIAAPISYELTPKLTIGASLRFPFGLFEQKTTQDILGAFTKNGEPIGSYGLGFTQVTSEMFGYGKPGFLLGINYEVFPFLRIAATYRSKITVTLRGESHMILNSNVLFDSGLDAIGDWRLGVFADLLNDIPEVGSLLSAQPSDSIQTFAYELASDIESELDWSIPKAVELGFALDVTPNLLFAVDWRHQYHEEANQEFVVRLTEPLFKETGMGELGQRLAWRDVYMWSFGLQYRYSDTLFYRVGYSRGNSATPEAYTNPFTPPPASEQDSYYFGVGLLDGPWQYDFGFNYAEVKNEIAQPLDKNGEPVDTPNCRPGQLVKSGCPGEQSVTSLFFGLSLNYRY